jgi:tRNA(fMet)-specific endonuclease VapC
MNYLIDTNICIYIMNKRPPEVIKRFKIFEAGEIGISAITVSELQYGVAKSAHRKQNQQRLAKFLVPLAILAYDEIAAGAHGDIRFELEKHGRSIGPLDLLIAAQAMIHSLTLVTNNDKEFKRIKDLKVVNWTQ